MKGTRIKERTGVYLSGQEISVAGCTHSSDVYALGSWGEPYIEMQRAFNVPISGLRLSTPKDMAGVFWSDQQKEVPSVDIDRKVGEVPIVILEYEDGFTVYPLEIDGVVSQGDTLPQAMHNVKEAISLYIESFGRKRLIPKDERAVRVFVSKTTVSP